MAIISPAGVDGGIKEVEARPVLLLPGGRAGRPPQLPEVRVVHQRHRVAGSKVIWKGFAGKS